MFQDKKRPNEHNYLFWKANVITFIDLSFCPELQIEKSLLQTISLLLHIVVEMSIPF